MKQRLKGSIQLLIGTLIWGSAFVAQSVGMDFIEPFTFQTVRSFIAIFALFACDFYCSIAASIGILDARIERSFSLGALASSSNASTYSGRVI